MTDANAKLEEAKGKAGKLSDLNDIYNELVVIEGDAQGQMTVADDAAYAAGETKQQMDDLVAEIAGEIDGAKALKQQASDAYDTAAMYNETQAQQDAEERARIAYLAAKADLEAIEGYHSDAVSMQGIADTKRSEANTAADEANQVDF